METILGILEEFYVSIPATGTLLEKTEDGDLACPCDSIVDSKSLLDLITQVGDPKPSDEGSLLWIKWCRERLEAKALRSTIWGCTQDQVADPMTKKDADPTLLLAVMTTGELVTRYSALCEGVLLHPEKEERK